MKLLLDANMPRSTKAALEQRGFDVTAVRDILPPATPDPVIYDLAKREGRLLITRDHDFLNILLYPPAGSAPTIVMWPKFALWFHSLSLVGPKAGPYSRLLSRLHGRERGARKAG